MRIKDLRAMPDAELNKKKAELELELGIERRKIASTGVASKRTKVSEIKRTIAQINTLLNERKMKGK
jgi:ribosomal protein L29